MQSPARPAMLMPRLGVGWPRLGMAAGALALFVLTAPRAWAQPTQGPIVSGVVGAMAIDSSTDLSWSVAAGYRFNRVIGLGIELTSTPEIDSDDSMPYGLLDANEFFALGLRPIPYRNPEGQATIFTTNIRLDVPTTSARIVPYAMAGGGVANVKQSFDAIILPAVRAIPARPATLELMPTIYPPPYWQPYLASSTNLALTFGGGVSVLAGERVSIDVDLRYLRLIGERDRNVGRFGAGASYRF